MTRIRLDTQVKWKLPANSLSNSNETIDGEKIFSQILKTRWNFVQGDETSWTGIFLNFWTPSSTQKQIDSYTNGVWFRDLLLNWWYLTIQADWKTKVNSIFPSVDNSYTCGANSNRWSAIWSANWTIQTSDERQKTDIQGSELGLDFINKLNPVSYKWKVGGNEVSYEEIEVEKKVQETVEEIQKIETIEEINGKFVKVIKEEKIQIPVYDEVDLYDEAWEIIGKHQIPKMVKKLVKEQKEVIKSKPGSRNHFGFIAQEVEEALGGVDFWGLVIDENGQYALRYDQFISPLVSAIKELKARVEFLENKML